MSKQYQIVNEENEVTTLSIETVNNITQMFQTLLQDLPDGYEIAVIRMTEDYRFSVTYWGNLGDLEGLAPNSDESGWSIVVSAEDGRIL